MALTPGPLTGYMKAPQVWRCGRSERRSGGTHDRSGGVRPAADVMKCKSVLCLSCEAKRRNAARLGRGGGKRNRQPREDVKLMSELVLHSHLLPRLLPGNANRHRLIHF